MESIESFRRLFEYDRWGNHAALASLGSIAGPVEKPLKVFSHVLGAQHVWRARFDDPRPPNAQPWPVLTQEECRSGIDEIYQGWVELLDKFSNDKLSNNLVYYTTQGAKFETPIRDVLTHLLMHSAYHRGQVAAAVREAGGKPAVTDYAVYLRQRK
ncbi:MAG TPA: DinB family protein [Terriglobia bacterium]|nr:DinB family protein [Terriglobia bacterium]